MRPNPSKKPSRKRAAKPATPDDYLADLPGKQRAALQKLRRTIKAAAPAAEECISYGLPAFRIKGRFLLAYGAAAKHCAFYPGSVVQALKTELRNYGTSKGTIRFSPDKPLPARLIRKVVKLRLAERRDP